MVEANNKKKKRWLDIFELEDLDKSGGKLTKREKKRLRVFREKRAKLDKLCKGNECKVCGREIPRPSEYCSSECRRKGHGEERPTKDEPKRAQKTL